MFGVGMWMVGCRFKVSMDCVSGIYFDPTMPAEVHQDMLLRSGDGLVRWSFKKVGDDLNPHADMRLSINSILFYLWFILAKALEIPLQRYRYQQLLSKLSPPTCKPDLAPALGTRKQVCFNKSERQPWLPRARESTRSDQCPPAAPPPYPPLPSPRHRHYPPSSSGGP